VCEGPLTDYTGELQGTAFLRLTDRAVGPTATQPGTLDRFAFPFSIPCTPTADPAVGSDCNVTTSLNAILPTVVRESKRAMWQLGRIEVWDGGADGDADTDDNTVFAVQGVFVP
jgi:hypothetical protein